MDPHHHHQHQQWRPRPTIPGNICPSCSNSHFPFCPPHPSYAQNPRFPFDPYYRPTGPSHPSFPNPNDGFGDLRPWHRNPSLERDPYGQLQSQSHSNGLVNEGDRNYKRPRVDDNEYNNNNNNNNQNYGVLSEDERRLKLIREHGGSLSGMNSGFNSETNRYLPESLVFDGNYGRASVGEYGKFDGFRGGRGELGPIGRRNIERGDFQEPGIGSGNRRGQQYMQNDRSGFHSDSNNGFYDSQKEEFPHSQYGQPRISEGVHTQNPQQWQSNDSTPLNEPQNSYKNKWKGMSVPYHEQKSSVTMENRDPNNQVAQPYGMQHPVHMRHDYHLSGQSRDARQTSEVNFPSQDGNWGSAGHQNMPGVAQHGTPNLNERAGYFSSPGNSIVYENRGQMEASWVYGRQPPLPSSPPPPLPMDPALRPSSQLKAYSSPPKSSASLFPVPVSSSAMVSSSYPPIPEAHSLTQPYFHNKPPLHGSTAFFSEESQAIHRMPSTQFLAEGQPFSLKQLSSDKPKVIDASQLFKQPHRAARPDHIAIILRGLPGSGKSYVAKMLRDLEVENGGDAPRIHSMDDYFMTEIEKVEEGDVSKSSSLVRGKRPITKKVMEYCYEPEMEEAYRSSMLKAFKRTLEEGVFTFIIVDDRNLRVADFAHFWAFAKNSGYEVYVLEATYKDPVGCAARNVHGFNQDDIEKMASQWEEAPSLYLQLDIKSLFHGDDLKESGIQEVDMDMDDGDFDRSLSGLQESQSQNTIVPPVGEAPDALGSPEDRKRWDPDGNHPTEVKQLSRSKWSDDLDDDDTEKAKGVKGNLGALSGLVQAYGKKGKSVRWSDQVGNTGFSIGAAKRANVLSLVIGPGAGYNLKSNPLPEESPTSTRWVAGSKRQNVFQEQLRAERESFKAVFDRRRQRIGGLDLEEE